MVNAVTRPTGTLIRPSTSRRKSRIAALQALFEFNSVGHIPEQVLERRAEEQNLTPNIEMFAKTLVDGVLANCEEIDKIITAFAPNWPVSQMAIIDRNILRIAIYEITMGEETPPKVAVNEAVELAKVFGSDSSPKFVNGVLGSVMETVKRESYSS